MLWRYPPGMGPMPWTINSEIYPLWARSTGNSVATFTNWLFNLVVSMSFLSLTQALTRYGKCTCTLFNLVVSMSFLSLTQALTRYGKCTCTLFNLVVFMSLTQVLYATYDKLHKHYMHS